VGDTILPEGTGKQVQSLAKWLPRLAESTAGAIGPYEQSLFNSRSNIDPQNLALDESLAKYFLPRFSQIGTDIQGQEALNTAQNELNVVNGSGGDLARAGLALNKEIDPQYYNLRETGANKFTDLLNGQDPNRLTGSEMANVERGLNRTNRVGGVADVPASSSAIRNAMTFGGALDKKRNTLVNTLQALPQNLASMKSGTDAFQVATGRPSYGANPATGQYSTGRSGFGANVQSMSQGLLGEAGQNQRQTQDLTANARDALDRVNETAGTALSVC